VLSKTKMFLFYLLLFLVMPFSIVLMLLFRKNDNYIRKIRVATATIFVKIFNFKYEVVGEPSMSTNILILNHLSDLDVIFFEYFYPRNICWVAKKELGDVPFFGLALKLPKMILIDRKDKRGGMALIKAIKKRIEEGRTICIFPEGTRGDGEKLLPFKSGTKAVIELQRQPIQPVVLNKTRDIFDPKGFRINSGSFRVEFLPPFMPDYGDKKWFDKLHKNMENIYLQNK